MSHTVIEQSEGTKGAWEYTSRYLTTSGLGIAFQNLCKWKIWAAKEAGGLFFSLSNIGTTTV